jgi:hypothetical protein
LARSVPDQETADGDELIGWVRSVEIWREDTNKFLSLYSPRASAAFVLVVDSHNIDNLVACRSEFVTRDAAGSVGVFPLDRPSVG